MIDLRNETHPKLAPQSIHGYALSVIAGGVVLAILYWARTVFITSIVAIIIALILEPFVGLLVRLRLPRAIATFAVSAIAVLVIYVVGLGAYSQASSVASEFPQFRERFSVVVDGVRGRVQAVEEASTRIFARKNASPLTTGPASSQTRRAKGKQTNPPPPDLIQEVRIHQDSNPISDFIFSRLGSLYEFILLASFVPFLVFFMLSWRDHIHRSFLRFFEGSDRIAAARSLDSISGVARAFVVGNFLIGLLTAVFSASVFAVLRIPYPLLAGGLSGFLSIMPYVGVPLGIVPPLLTAIAGGRDTSVLLLVILAVLVLHVTALNVLYPKLVGARVHLNPLVVTFSLMFWGFLWDAAGLVLAIPLTAGLKAVCDNVAALRPVGRFLGD